jgi:hypothetical protein
MHAFGFGAVLATEKRSRLLQAVPDDASATMGAGRRQRMDRAHSKLSKMWALPL